MPEHRKLAAILAADVAGYSKLAGADEERTLARLRALRSDLIDPTIAVHHGRVVDTIRESAEAAGVFGVPSLIVEGELFWGREHLADTPRKIGTICSNQPCSGGSALLKRAHVVLNACLPAGLLSYRAS